VTDEYIYGEDERLVAWLEEKIAGTLRSDAVAIGRETDGALRGVAAFDTFTPTSCLIHLASDGSRRWMTREFITRVFAYPFVQCGFRRVTCIISATNADSLRVTRHFGWVQEGVLRKAGTEGEDIIVFGMLREECRFLPPLLMPVGMKAEPRYKEPATCA